MEDISGWLFSLDNKDSASPHSLQTKAHQSDNMAAASTLKIRTPEEAGKSSVPRRLTPPIARLLRKDAYLHNLQLQELHTCRAM